MAFLSENHRKVERIIEESYSVFVSGKAGSGKSFFLRYIMGKIRRKGLHCFVTAPTGIAAQNIGGITIHSFAGIGTGSKSISELICAIKADAEAESIVVMV